MTPRAFWQLILWICSVSRLTLTADGEHEHGVDHRNEAVKRYVAVTAVADDERSVAAPGRTSDQRAVGKDVERLDDLRNAPRRIGNIEGEQVVEESIEVIQDFGYQLDPDHASP